MSLHKLYPCGAFTVLLAFGPFVPDVFPETVELHPVADTTLIQIAPDNNLGAAWFFNAGTTTQNGYRNHALLRFDIAASVPPGSIIRSAELVLEVIREPAVGGTDSYFGLHRVLVPWGEGDKTHEGTPQEPISPGVGSPAGPGDATWNNRFHPDVPWSVPGGAPSMDYVGLISSGQFVQGTAESPYSFPSSPELVSDVQSWLDNPQANFGWMLISDLESEGVRSTARSFSSRESPFPPQLFVNFEPVPEPQTILLWGTGLLTWYGLRSCRRKNNR